MTQKAAAAFDPHTSDGPDLSPDIIAAVQKEPGDQVRCVRVFANNYRCNWWGLASDRAYDNPAMKGGQLSTTHCIRKSQFLEVTRAPDGLRIQVLSSSLER